jgi:Xaa-Pro aminopeptidase
MIPFRSKIPYDYETRRKYIDTPFPLGEYRGRLRKVRLLMEEKGLEALMVYSNPAGSEGSGHLTYLTSFAPLGGNAVLLLPLDGEPTLIFDGIFHSEPINSMNWTTWVKDVHPSTGQDLPANIKAWLEERGMDKSRIGLVGERMIPWEIWYRMEDSLSDVTWMPLTRPFNDIQKRKSPREMEIIRKVCGMTNDGMRAGIDAVKPGITEGEIIGEIVREFRRKGAHDVSFNPCIASGPKGGLKHSYPTLRKIQRGDLVYIDVGAKYYGYNTDMSRVMVVGKPTSKQKYLLDADRKAYYTLLGEMKPGVPVTEILDLAAELEVKSRIHERYGGDVYLNFACSHAMSTGFAEWSLLDGRTVLEPNLSPLAFEPMVVILDFGTIVIESMVAITEKGVEVLTPLELDWM